MRTHTIRLVAALVATIATAFVTGTASASTIFGTPAGAITATSLGRLTFAGRGGIEIAVNCRNTLRGSINRTISNARGGSVGAVTEGRANECSTGTTTLLVEPRAPWALTLGEATRLAGSPKLAAINVAGAKIQVAGIFGQTCLYEGTIPMQLEGEGPEEAVVTRLLRALSNSESIVRNSGLCPGSGELRGTLETTRQTLNLERLWSAGQSTGEDRRGRRQLITTFTYRGPGEQTITDLTPTPSWIISDLNCIGVFRTDYFCRVTATKEAGSRREILVLIENGEARVTATFEPEP